VSASTATAHPRRVSARVVAEAAERLAAPSAVVSGVLGLLDEGSAPVRLIAARVGQSPEISAQVLRLANSALFTEPVDSIDRAIVRIGERSLRGLLLAASTYRLLEGPMPLYGLPRLSLFRHSGEVAAMAQSLARRGPAALASQAYLAGLLHDLGKPILAAVAGEHVTAAHAPEAIDSVACERELIGTDHATVGTWIARRWGLPDELCTAMERHHAPLPPPEPVARAVWLADVAVHAGHGEPEAVARLPEAAAACGLAGDALESLLVSSPQTDGPRRPPGLTDREVQVLRMLATGATAKQVAHRLGCSPSTVHNHLHHVYRKLGVSGQAQALLLARERGWV
jgi:putative nucleotidyltransferase with HDIG domain